MVSDDGFVPVVHKIRAFRHNRTMLDDLLEIAAERIAVDKSGGENIRTGIHGLYASNKAVEPHQDLDGAEPGMLVRGLVLRSDGHRLHSRRLDEAGLTEGLALEVGDHYELDPYDEHWTTVPPDAGEPVLIFYVEGDQPDERTTAEIVNDLLGCLEWGLQEWARRG